MSEDELPFKMPNGPLDRYVRWRQEQGRILVKEGHDGNKRLLRWMLLSALVLIAISALRTFPGWIGTICSLISGGLIALVATIRSQRAQAYRSGWLEGRVDVFRTLEETRKEGGTPADAFRSIQIFDMVHVLGFGVAVPNDIEGLE